MKLIPEGDYKLGPFNMWVYSLSRANIWYSWDKHWGRLIDELCKKACADMSAELAQKALASTPVDRGVFRQ